MPDVVYVGLQDDGNRGYNSIAGFAVDRATGRLTPACLLYTSPSPRD